MSLKIPSFVYVHYFSVSSHRGNFSVNVCKFIQEYAHRKYSDPQHALLIESITEIGTKK